jgi:hypothetical protein
MMKNKNICSMLSGLKKLSTTGRPASGVLVLAFILLSFQGCNHRPDHPGWDFFPDMFYSPAYQTWSENFVLPDSMTMQTPVPGTIPGNIIPFQYERTDEDRERAGRELVNPIRASIPSVERGDRAYTVFCMNCHGERGDGLGYLFTSGRYLVPPTSLRDESTRDLSDGEIYHVITLGYGVMAEHGSIILPDDRWMIINYIRQEFQEQMVQE